MKRPPSLDQTLNLLALILSLLALLLVGLATFQFQDTVPVYRGF